MKIVGMQIEFCLKRFDLKPAGEVFDEKRQMHRFLGHLLPFCLLDGPGLLPRGRSISETAFAGYGRDESMRTDSDSCNP